jgi:hypothetical protein
MKTISKIKHKNIEPKEYEVSFKYQCLECRNDHWLFLREVSVKNFKIVCECGSILLPKTIADMSIAYQNNNEEKKVVVPPPVPPLDIRKECATILESFGYSENEIDRILTIAIESVKRDYIKEVINYSLKNLGDKNV